MEIIGSLRLGTVMDLLLDAVCVVDRQGRFVYVSAACERIFGYTAEEMVGRPMIELVFPDDRAKTFQAVDEIVAGHSKPSFENRYVRKDGRIVHIMWSARWSEPDQVRVAVARDVTERKQAEAQQAALYAISEAAHAAEDLLALFQRIHHTLGTLLPAVNCFVALYDEAADHLSFPYHVDQHHPAPPAGKLDAGTLSAQVIRTRQAVLLSRDLQAMAAHELPADVGRAAIDWLGVPLNTHSRTIGALVVKSHADHTRYTEQDIELLKFVSTQVAAAIERKQTETRLYHAAQHDPLTDLPNRSLFYDRVGNELKRARRDNTCLAVLYLDLDQFKQVNDRYGHAVGDSLLQAVAQRLQGYVREADTVGRMGGDEFVLLLGGLQAAEQAEVIAEKVRLALCQPFELLGHRLCVSPSIGMALYPAHGDDCAQLIQRADEAMYEAKQAGGNRVGVVSSGEAPGSGPAHQPWHTTHSLLPSGSGK